VLPETDDVDIYFRVMAHTVAASFPDPDDRQSWMVEWLRTKAPWLENVEYTADRYLPAPGCPVKHLKARPAGEALCLTYAERKAFGIGTISAFDKTPAETRELRRQDDRDRKRLARAAKGSKPRSESLSQARPWEAEGIHRSTYYRHLKRQVETNSAHHDPSAETRAETNSAHHPNAGETNSSAPNLSYKYGLLDSGSIGADEFVSPSIVPTILDIETDAARQRGPSRAPAARSRQLDLFDEGGS
jgi:hypothetical protein